MRGVIKANLFPLLILSLLVAVLQYLILKPHLRYAFADVDWVFLLSFKQLSLTYQDPVRHFFHAWVQWGIYTYQVYYIGLIEQFFGFSYENFQVVSLVFKVIATLSIYPVIYLITKSKLAAFLTTLIYAITYSSVGVMYTVVTSGLFVAIPFMNLFFIWYWCLLSKSRNRFFQILLGVILFFITLLLATERMFPLIPVIILIEIFWWFKNGFSKVMLTQGLKRLLIFTVPFLAAFLYHPSILTPVSGNAEVTYQKFLLGNWQVILSPLISLGSLFAPKDFWPLFGTPLINNFFQYIGFLISGPFIAFTVLSVLFSIFISKNKANFLLDILISNIFLSIAIYFLSTHELHIPDPNRMHFDSGYVIPALIGGFVLSFALAIFREWLRGEKKSNLLISAVGGIVIAFVFIVITWIPADFVLVFFGVHRYLTIPAIGSSLLVACLMTVMFNKMRTMKSLRNLAFIIFLLFIPLTLFNSKIISDHMKYELEFAGTESAGHIRMKGKLWSFLGNLSKSEPSVFYFDESQDHANGYFDETTVMAGFNYWMQFRGRDIVNPPLTHVLLRSNLICPEPGSMCLNKVKSLITSKDGEKGILYGDAFYKSQNFYAFRFINRDIVDIRDEVVKAIGLK